MPRILLVDEDAGAPPRSCAVETSCHRGRAPLRQTLAVAPRHPAALQRRSLDAPWHTPRAEIVRLRGVPINRDAGEYKALAREEYALVPIADLTIRRSSLARGFS